MASYLFGAWILYFITALEKECGISPTNHHFLVLDGHNLHITLYFVTKARAELDIVSLRSHTSHHLQQLDVVVFWSFK
jgi:hypothetical protein